MVEVITVLSVFLIMGFTLYGAALILSEHFFIGLLLLLFLSPIFFIWAFCKGIIGK